MSQEILDKLGELKAGLGELKAGQDGIGERLDRLESEVGLLRQDFTEHRQGTNDSFELALKILKGNRATGDEGGPPAARFGGSR